MTRQRFATTPAGRVVLLILLCIALFLPGFFSMPPVDRDEARFGQASRQMIETGDFVDIRFQEEPRHKKPIGIYWLQSVAAWVVGGPDAPIWAYRLPSLLGAVAAVLLTYWVALPLVGARAAFLAAALFAASVLLGVEARLAKTDAVLLVAILAAQGVLARLYVAFQEARLRKAPVRSIPLWQAVVFWVALAAGVLVKGPIIVMIVGLTAAGVAIVERSLAWLRPLRPLPGFLLFLLLAAPWFVAIWLRTDGAFFGASLDEDLFGKVGQGQESHWAPPLTYLAILWLTFWPASMALVAALPGIWRGRWSATVRFLAVWVLPSWIVFEIVATKLPHYVLPLYPALAILAARLGRPPADEPVGIVRRGLLAILLIAPLLLAGAVWFGAIRLGESLPLPVAGLVVLATIALVSCIGGAWRAMMLFRWNRAYAWAVAAAISLSWTVYPLLSHTDYLWPSRQVSRVVDAFDGCADPRLFSYGFREPSLVFLTGTQTVLAKRRDGYRAFLTEPCALAAVEARESARFFDAMAQADASIIKVGHATGASLGNGQQLDITVYSVDKQAAPP